MGYFIGFSALIILQVALITISLTNRINQNTKDYGAQLRFKARSAGRSMNEN